MKNNDTSKILWVDLTERKIEVRGLGEEIMSGTTAGGRSERYNYWK